MLREPVKIGISRCLLGDPVRYDGGHKLDSFLVRTLGRYVSFVPVCPEVECGLSVPRAAMRLAGNSAAPRLMTIKTGKDLTDQMQAWARRRLDELARDNLCGFIFKKNSPSCGLRQVQIYNARGVPSRSGAGIFARAFKERFPLVPMEEDVRLHDPARREYFIERIFGVRRRRPAISRLNMIKRRS